MEQRRIAVELLGDGVDGSRVGFQGSKKGRVVAEWGADECEGRHPQCHLKDEVENRYGDGAIRLVQMICEAALELVAQVWE